MVTINKSNTVMLDCDLQNGIMGMIAANPGLPAVRSTAGKLVDAARAASLDFIHVGIAFEQGHPEIASGLPSYNMFGQVKGSPNFVKGTPSVDFIPEVYKEGDHVVRKQRVSAFCQRTPEKPSERAAGGLEEKLRAAGKSHIILFGVATSGIVLSTVREGFDLDFEITVVEDACLDREDDVHDFLVKKVLPKSSRVVKSDEVIKALQG